MSRERAVRAALFGRVANVDQQFIVPTSWRRSTPGSRAGSSRSRRFRPCSRCVRPSARISLTRQPPFPTPPALVVHGLASTGKSAVVEAVLEGSGAPFAIVQSRECITARHLLEKAAAASTAVCRALLRDAIVPQSQRCENVNSLAVHLDRILRQLPKLILVFDGIDKQREAAPTLTPGLVRLGSIVWDPF
jgi:hypothetical protein